MTFDAGQCSPATALGTLYIRIVAGDTVSDIAVCELRLKHWAVTPISILGGFDR